jgi:hypothetical protein
LNKYNVKLNAVLKECEKHLQRLNSAFDKMKIFMPISPEKYQQLNDAEIEHIDQYLFRFSKLQDAIGERLFKSLLLFLGEEVHNKSFIDVFNRLEQLEIIENYDNWMELREIRNELTHEYEDEPSENAEKINKIYLLKDKLARYYLNVEKFLSV